MPTAYHFRYTTSDHDLQSRIVDFLLRNTQSVFLCVREFGTQNEREHLQGYCEIDIAEHSFKNKFTAKFGRQIERRDKYFSPDRGSTLIYCCKGQSEIIPPDIVAKRNITNEQIADYHHQYWAVHNRPTLGPVVEQHIHNETIIMKPKRERQPTWMEKVRNAIEADYPDRDWIGNVQDYRIVFHITLKMLGSHCRTMSEYRIREIVNGLVNSFCKDKKSWHEYWFDKCFPNMPKCYSGDEMELDE